MVQRLLSRLLQYGHFDIAGVQLALEVLHVDIKSKDERALTRLVHYLVHLGLGDGSAGTPLPVPVASGGAGVRQGLTPGFARQLDPDGRAPSMLGAARCRVEPGTNASPNPFRHQAPLTRTLTRQRPQGRPYQARGHPRDHDRTTYSDWPSGFRAATL